MCLRLLLPGHSDAALGHHTDLGSHHSLAKRTCEPVSSSVKGDRSAPSHCPDEVSSKNEVLPTVPTTLQSAPRMVT